eukprot:SAG31_NODE_2956_length_4858_cov_151.713385_2_plen_1333_part_00
MLLLRAAVRFFLCDRYRARMRMAGLLMHRAAILVSLFLEAGVSQRAQITFEILPELEDEAAPVPIEVFRSLSRSAIDSARDSYSHLRALGDSVYDMKVLHDQPAVDITSASGMSYAAGSDIDITAGGALSGRFNDEVDLLGGGLLVRTPGPVSAFAGSNVEMVADGGLFAMVTGAATMGAEKVQGHVSGDAELETAGSLRLVSGRSATVQGHGGSMFFGSDLNMTAQSASLLATDELRMSSNAVSFVALNSIQLATPSSSLKFVSPSTSELNFVAYVWRSSASFEQFENVFPAIAGVTEILIVADVGNALVMSEELTTVGLHVATTESEGLVWTQVWSMSAGSGVYSMSGQSIKLGKSYDVQGVRLTSSNAGAASHGSPVFERWAEVTFQFGVASSAGAIDVASETIELLSGASATIASETVTVSAAMELAISAAAMEVASGVITMQASEAASVVADQLSVASTGLLNVVSAGHMQSHVGAASATLTGDVGVLSAQLLVSSNSADLVSSTSVTMHGEKLTATSSESMTLHAGRAASLSTTDATLSAGSDLNMLASGNFDLTAESVRVENSGGAGSLSLLADEIATSVGEARAAAGAVSIISTGVLNALATESTINIQDSLHASIGEEVNIFAGAEVHLNGAAGIRVHAAGEASLAGGSALISSGASVNAFVGDSFEMNVDGSLSLQSSNLTTVVADRIVSNVEKNVDLSAGRMHLWNGGDLGVSSDSASVDVAGRFDLLAASTQIDATNKIVATARSVGINVADTVAIRTGSAVVDLVGADSELNFVAYVWRSSASFEQFENVFPVIAGVTEILIVADVGNTLVVSEELTTVGLHVATTESEGLVWTQVWSMSAGSGVYSMSGQSIKLGKSYDVQGVRLTSSNAGAASHGSPVFERWAEVTFQFGVASSAGAIDVASETIELLSGASATIASETVTVSAAMELAISAAAMEVASGVITMQASEAASVVADQLSVASTGPLEFVSSAGFASTAAATAIELTDSASLMTAGNLNVIVPTMRTAIETASVNANSFEIIAGSSVHAHVGATASISTHDASVGASGDVEVFAGAGVELTAGFGGVSVETEQIALNSVGHSVQLLSNQAASIRTAGLLHIDASDTLDVRSGTVKVKATDDPDSAARAAVTVRVECPDSSCESMTRNAVMDDLSSLLDVPLSRLYLNTIDLQNASSTEQSSAAGRRLEDAMDAPEDLVKTEKSKLHRKTRGGGPILVKTSDRKIFPGLASQRSDAMPTIEAMDTNSRHLAEILQSVKKYFRSAAASTIEPTVRTRVQEFILKASSSSSETDDYNRLLELWSAFHDDMESFLSVVELTFL